MGLREVLAHARQSKRTAHVTFFDIADAFGSVSHDLIKLTMERNGIPPSIVTYIQNLYGNLSGYVQGPDWSSQRFSFKKGTFQGDPFSPVLFILVFNPIIQYLKQYEDTHGYLLNGNRYITLPYADDFILITNDKRRHQKLLDEILKITDSMNLTLKLSKCKSMSISAGKSNAVPFTIGGTPLTFVKDSPELFLGSYVDYKGTSEGAFDYIHDKVDRILCNVETSSIRPEYKLKVYEKYVLSSLRFVLTVHDFTKTQLSKLDAISTKYVKKWLEMPSRGATSSIVHSPVGLNIPLLSDIYRENHAMRIAHGLLQSDERVQSVVEAKMDRELGFSKKSYGNVESAIIVQEVLEKTDTNDMSTIKKGVKDIINDDRNKKWEKVTASLAVQGQFLQLLSQQEEDLTWKSIIYSLPRRVLSFATRASIDALPTFRNLQRWGKRQSGTCNLCSNTQTLHHILNGCNVMLTQGRYTWRHDSILQHIWQLISSSDPVTGDVIQAHVDLPGHSGRTVPLSILPTTDRPDMVLINNERKELTILELTVPFEPNIPKSHTYKQNKYTPLANDLEKAGFKCQLLCFEVGSRGFISKGNKGRLLEFLRKVGLAKKIKSLCNDLCKLSLVTSYGIYTSRNEPQWNATDMFLLNG